MSVITKLLAWRNINTDSDFSKYIETVSEAWVINWLQVSTNKVGIWKCRVPCERNNWETIYALVDNKTEVTIDTSGTWYVIVEISQTYIDDWSLINEDWTWVATISVVQTKPSKNYLELASISSWTITDTRNMIKKVGELSTAIQSINASISDLDTRVEHLEEAGAIDHLEEQGLVGELYTMEDTLFKQLTPKLADSTVEQNVWDVDANKEIHIQRMWSWTASNKLKLKVKMSWSPTTNLKVEVREWVKVVVTEDVEAYRYWDSSKILATSTKAYTDFSSDWSEVEFTLSANVWGTKGQLLDVVVYQESSWTEVVNASNYYIIGCDSTQWSEAFSLVCVNGSTRTRSKLMPYCISTGFTKFMLCKRSKDYYSIDTIDQLLYQADTITFPNQDAKDLFELKEIRGYTYYVKLRGTRSNNAYPSSTLYVNWNQVAQAATDTQWEIKIVEVNQDLAVWDTMKITMSPWYAYWTSYTPDIKVIRKLNKLYKDTWKKELPQSLKTIWQIITCTLFWRLSSWERRDWK